MRGEVVLTDEPQNITYPNAQLRFPSGMFDSDCGRTKDHRLSESTVFDSQLSARRLHFGNDYGAHLNRVIFRKVTVLKSLL